MGWVLRVAWEKVVGGWVKGIDSMGAVAGGGGSRQEAGGLVASWQLAGKQVAEAGRRTVATAAR